MAFLNANERKALLDELTRKSFNQAKGKLQRMDSKGRLVFLRNVQNVNQWATRFDLNGLGTRVTLIEEKDESKESRQAGRYDVGYVLKEVIVEPLPENRT